MNIVKTIHFPLTEGPIFHEDRETIEIFYDPESNTYGYYLPDNIDAAETGFTGPEEAETTVLAWLAEREAERDIWAETYHML